MSATLQGDTSRLDLRFLLCEPAEVYHVRAKDHVTSHALRDFRLCPLLYRRKELGLISGRDAMYHRVGRAGRTLILEGRQRYEHKFAFGGPVNAKTGKPFRSNTQAFAAWAGKQSKPVLSDAQAAVVKQVAAAVVRRGGGRGPWSQAVAAMHGARRVSLDVRRRQLERPHVE